ncbi:MAG TPA: DNA primase [Gemmatimonadales bacterium]|jgi:DNA primase|nr:DNA primase [Gemmatimonadales bacterium]
MSMIPDELIEQIRDSANLVEIIGEAVSLKRTGSDYRGSCPFHGGTHRNFAVIPKKGMYYCYVCHEAGDVFKYYMKKQGLDYPSAVREVARRVGITVPERGGREGPDPREPLFTAAAVAQEWFAARLCDDPEAEPARSYLAGREIPLEVAGEQGLGFAPRGSGFLEAMRQLGLAERELLEAGLLATREDGTVVPRFRGRLLFPIRDLRGRVVGFGGRLLGPGEPKYLNSPESPIFHKGSMLYNLHEAKQAIRREEAVILVEGYFDVLRLVLAGLDHVVAPLGTALTPDQAALLRRVAPLALLLYDSDSAGLRASFRAADECLRHKMRVRVATMPTGEDPDSLVRTGGASALAPILRDAVDVLDRKIQLLERKGWFEGLEHRREALDRLLPTARAAADPITRDLYLRRIEELTGVKRAVLEQELAAHPEPLPPPPAGPGGRTGAPEARRLRPGARIEARLLETLLSAPEWRARARAEIPASQLEVPAYREIFEALVALAPEAAAGDALPGLAPRAQEAWQRLMAAAAERRGSGMNLDAEYVGAAEYLRQRELTRTLPPVSDVQARQSRLQELPVEARQRLSFRKQADPARRRPPGRPAGPAPDPSSHP